MAYDELLQALIDAHDAVPYPADFLAAYTPMECLAERPGVDSFLVQDGTGARFVAKCYDKSAWDYSDNDDLLNALEHEGLPKRVATFGNDTMLVKVREYVEGTSLERYAHDNDLSEQDIVRICVQLCDILAYLHHRDEPIIHRDVKPQNIIVKPDGSVALIDFDIARVYREENDTDTRFFGTLVYAPPEQYGFAQTDARADIYSLGVVLRYLLTGSPRQNQNVRVYRPLAKIIDKCTAFAPKERFDDVGQVKKALLQANPASQAIRFALIAAGVLVAVALLAFAGVKAYEAATYSPFNDDAIPATLNDEERVADAVSYMKDKYGTHLFDGDVDDVATVGLLRTMLVELYGLDREYVYNYQKDGLPSESDEWFMAWGWEDSQNIRRDTAVYAAVKVHDPSLVAEDQWSQLEDDNGEYPGCRVAELFAEKTGILTGAGRPYDITVGELALIFANADRVFDAAAK